MTKEEIKKRINNFQSDEEIFQFLNQRIIELENESEEKTVGQEYTDTFNDFIGSNIHYKPTATIGKKRLPSPELIYDDYEPYIEILKELNLTKQYDTELATFTPIMNIITHYMSSGANELDLIDRTAIYYFSALKGIQSISIKEFKHRNCGFCSERAGMAHNIFKILGIDSQVVVGKRNNELHTFNLVFPKGYKNMPAVLIDVSNPVRCTSPGEKITYTIAYYKVLSEDEYNRMLTGETVPIDNSKATELLLNYYKQFNVPEDTIPIIEKASYSIGNERYVKSGTRITR